MIRPASADGILRQVRTGECETAEKHGAHSFHLFLPTLPPPKPSELVERLGILPRPDRLRRKPSVRRDVQPARARRQLDQTLPSRFATRNALDGGPATDAAVDLSDRAARRRVPTRKPGERPPENVGNTFDDASPGTP